MKRFILIFALSIFYFAACTNSNSATNEYSTEHTHEDGTTHTHEDGTTHSHDEGDENHAQEEIEVDADSLKQDSLKKEEEGE